MPDLWLTTDALLRAWSRVHDNGGCAGADGVTIERFAGDLDANIGKLQEDVATGVYRPLPLLPIVVRKKPGSLDTRTLLVPAVRDRVLQTAAAHHLGRAFEDEFLECSFAYRPHRSVNSAIARIRYLHQHGFAFVAEADIDSFFDRVDHAVLRERLTARVPEPKIRDLVAEWIGGFRWDGHGVRRIAEGIPQGSPISPLLANFFLSDFDLALEEAGLKLIRYADDFLILCRDRDKAAPASPLRATSSRRSTSGSGTRRPRSAVSTMASTSSARSSSAATSGFRGDITAGITTSSRFRGRCRGRSSRSGCNRGRSPQWRRRCGRPGTAPSTTTTLRRSTPWHTST